MSAYLVSVRYIQPTHIYSTLNLMTSQQNVNVSNLYQIAKYLFHTDLSVRTSHL